MYIVYMPPLALGYPPRNEAAGHQIVSSRHSAWASGRHVAPTDARSFLPSGAGFPWLNEPASGITNGWEQLA